MAGGTDAYHLTTLLNEAMRMCDQRTAQEHVSAIREVIIKFILGEESNGVVNNRFVFPIA
jgi:hypothetical protein